MAPPAQELASGLAAAVESSAAHTMCFHQFPETASLKISDTQRASPLAVL